jgi:hypothetical protein
MVVETTSGVKAVFAIAPVTRAGGNVVPVPAGTTITLDQVLAKTVKILDGSAGIADLSAVRRTLNDPAFCDALKDHLRGLNDPDIKTQILEYLLEIRERGGDFAARRKNQLTNLRYGIGGGMPWPVQALLPWRPVAQFLYWC